MYSYSTVGVTTADHRHLAVWDPIVVSLMKLLWGSYNFRGLYSELVLVRRRRSEKVLKGATTATYETSRNRTNSLTH